MRKLVLWLLFIVFLTCCFLKYFIDYKQFQEKEALLKTSNHILNNYSSEAIDYFYNVVYYSEIEKSKQKIIKRWEKDIKVYVHGNPSVSYISELKKNIRKIDSLKLGIPIYMVDDPSQANLDVYFNSKKNLDTLFNSTLNFKGIGVLHYKGNEIETAKIGVVVTNISLQKVKNILLEEMIQIMGPIGDGFTHKESLFNENGLNKFNDLTDLDIEILKLLYDPKISIRHLTLKNYEYFFGHLLPNVNTTKKMLKHWEKIKPSKTILQKIRTTCFDKDSIFRKFVQPIRIKLSGDLTQKDSLNVAKVIHSLNTIEGLNLQLKEKNDKSPYYEVQLNYKRVTSKEGMEQRVLTRHIDINNVMTPTLIKTDIELNINHTFEDKTQISLIFSALYQAIGPYKEEAFEGELRNDKIYEALLPIEYMELLKIIYHKSFASGLSLEEFDQTVKQYEKR